MQVVNDLSDFPILTTERLLLRPFQLADSAALFDILHKESVMRYFGMYPFKDMGEAVQLIERFRIGYIEGRSIRWAITDRYTGNLLGSCGFQNLNLPSRRAELGYDLDDLYWHKGYMSEALNCIIGYGFDYLNFQRIEALVYPENTPSSRVLLKMGFQYEGLLRQYAFFREVYQDLELYGLLNPHHVRED